MKASSQCVEYVGTENSRRQDSARDVDRFTEAQFDTSMTMRPERAKLPPPRPGAPDNR